RGRAPGRGEDPDRAHDQVAHSGFLAGDDWEAEYEAMGEGDPMYFDKLAKYLTFYLGRTGTPIDAFGPRRATTCGNASAARSASPPRRVWTRVSV
ncbi:MAG TPA: hypothetical protein VFR44_01650, partial [Actinomycetota bacterium]|nr:hypothetical protein [Actinomycetota bacterium]